MRHDLFHFSGSNIPHAAILISRDRNLGTHTGIVYRNYKNKNLERIDFYLGGQIASRPWTGRRCHVIPNIDDDFLINLAALCKVVSDRYSGGIAEHLYGFSRPQKVKIKPDGTIYLGDTAGMSCASFVLVLLEVTDIKLVSEDWPRRPNQDDPRHENILQELAENGTSSADIEKARAELPCPRVAPEEVAGAAMYPKLQEEPSTQFFAESAGKWIIGLFDLNDNYSVYNSAN